MESVSYMQAMVVSLHGNSRRLHIHVATETSHMTFFSM